MKKVFSNDKTRIRTGFHRTRNLKDLLVPSALPDLNRTDNSNSDTVRPKKRPNFRPKAWVIFTSM